MTRIRVGAVGFLNARPLVFGLERDPRFEVRFDLPARCADLLHAGETDLGLIPSIEYLRAPQGPASYEIVPDCAVASRGAVASVALFTTRDMKDVRSIALDTSSRTSVALTRVMCARVFGITPRLEAARPDLGAMLAQADAALLIGDVALFQDTASVPVGEGGAARTVPVEKIDLGALWTSTTGLPFVYAFWAGRVGVLSEEVVRALQAVRAAGAASPGAVAAEFFAGDQARRAVGEQYLRDNIKYRLGPEERAGLERFYQYAAETGVVARADTPRFFGEPIQGGPPVRRHVMR